MWMLGFCVRTEQLTVTTERKTNSNECLLICLVREVRHEVFNTNDVFLLLKSFKNRVLQNINFESNKYRINITKITAQLKDDEFLEVLALETAAIMTSCWCWVSRASWCFSTRYRFGSVSACWWGGGGFLQPCVVFLARRVIAVLSHVLCPVSFLSFLQPTSTPTRSWDGERKPSRSGPWRRDTSTEFSCTSELSDWSFCPRETTRWAFGENQSHGGCQSRW